MNFPLLKTGLIVDFNNLYFSIQNKYGPKRLQMLEYVKFLEQLGHTLTYKIAFSPQQPDKAQGFITLLKSHGFEIYYGKQNYALDMGLRCADIVPNIDSLVIGSNTKETATILSWAKEKGKITKCFACNIPPFFKEFATCIEIPENLLNAANPIPKQVELPANIPSDGT